MMPCISRLHTFHFVSNTSVRTENNDFEQVVGIVLLVVGNKNLLPVTPPSQLEVSKLLPGPKNWFGPDLGLIWAWGPQTGFGLGTKN